MNRNLRTAVQKFATLQAEVGGSTFYKLPLKLHYKVNENHVCVEETAKIWNCSQRASSLNSYTTTEATKKLTTAEVPVTKEPSVDPINKTLSTLSTTTGSLESKTQNGVNTLPKITFPLKSSAQQHTTSRAKLSTTYFMPPSSPTSYISFLKPYTLQHTTPLSKLSTSPSNPLTSDKPLSTNTFFKQHSHLLYSASLIKLPETGITSPFKSFTPPRTTLFLKSSQLQDGTPITKSSLSSSAKSSLRSSYITGPKLQSPTSLGKNLSTMLRIKPTLPGSVVFLKSSQLHQTKPTLEPSKSLQLSSKSSTAFFNTLPSNPSASLKTTSPSGTSEVPRITSSIKSSMVSNSKSFLGPSESSLDTPLLESSMPTNTKSFFKPSQIKRLTSSTTPPTLPHHKSPSGTLKNLKITSSIKSSIVSYSKSFTETSFDTPLLESSMPTNITSFFKPSQIEQLTSLTAFPTFPHHESTSGRSRLSNTTFTSKDHSLTFKSSLLRHDTSASESTTQSHSKLPFTSPLKQTTLMSNSILLQKTLSMQPSASPSTAHPSVASTMQNRKISSKRSSPFSITVPSLKFAAPSQVHLSLPNTASSGTRILTPTKSFSKPESSDTNALTKATTKISSKAYKKSNAQTTSDYFGSINPEVITTNSYFSQIKDLSKDTSRISSKDFADSNNDFVKSSGLFTATTTPVPTVTSVNVKSRSTSNFHSAASESNTAKPSSAALQIYVTLRNYSQITSKYTNSRISNIHYQTASLVGETKSDWLQSTLTETAASSNLHETSLKGTLSKHSSTARAESFHSFEMGSSVSVTEEPFQVRNSSSEKIQTTKPIYPATETGIMLKKEKETSTENSVETEDETTQESNLELSESSSTRKKFNTEEQLKTILQTEEGLQKSHSTLSSIGSLSLSDKSTTTDQKINAFSISTILKPGTAAKVTAMSTKRVTIKPTLQVPEIQSTWSSESNVKVMPKRFTVLPTMLSNWAF